MNHKVKITVSGTAGSGKSTVAAAIAKSLANMGADVSFEDGIFDFDDTYRTLIRNLNEPRVKKIVKQTTIEIKTKAIKRGP